MHSISKYLLWALALFAFIGFVDAMYLTINAFSGNVPPCVITGGCEVVTTSAYSRVIGIPIALMGALYYLTVFGLALGTIDNGGRILLRLATIFTSIGFAFTLWLLTVQTFILKAFCIYCLVSAVTTTILFILSWYLWVKSKTPPTPPEVTPLI